MTEFQIFKYRGTRKNIGELFYNFGGKRTFKL